MISIIKTKASTEQPIFLLSLSSSLSIATVPIPPKKIDGKEYYCHYYCYYKELHNALLHKHLTVTL